MKYPALLLCVIAILNSGCGTMTDARQSLTIGDWSDAVNEMRGRLVVEPIPDGKGGAVATIYLELQNLAPTPYRRQMMFSRGTDCFTWTLTNASKEPLPRWRGSVPWLYDYSELGYPLTLPAGATLRVPVSHVSYHVLLPRLPHDKGLPGSALVLEQDAPNLPWHLVSGSSTEGYFLSAKFKNELTRDVHKRPFLWHGELSLPAVQLPSDPSPRRHVWQY